MDQVNDVIPARSYYAILPADVRYDKNLIANAKLLYAEITALCNERGYCWASNSYFADLYGVSKVSISKWISNLVKQGYLNLELVYKENSREIQIRRIRINTRLEEGGMKEIDHTPERNGSGGMKENFTDNNKINNKNNNDMGKPISPLISKPDRKIKKAKDIDTMTKMVSVFTMDEAVRSKLLEYFKMRSKKGLEPNQWKIILDDLKKYTNNRPEDMLLKIDNAIAGGYMQIIASWEKESQTKPRNRQFDNTVTNRTSKAVVNMTKEEREAFDKSLVKDKDGNTLKF